MPANGNGNPEPVHIDVTNEIAFRTGVVQYFQILSDRTADLPQLKKKVEKHDRLVQYGKWTAIPLIAALHGIVDGAIKKYFGGH